MQDTAKRSAIQGLSQKRSVRAVVFDYGNVLGLEQTLEDMKRMALPFPMSDSQNFTGSYGRPMTGVISMDLPTGQRLLASKNWLSTRKTSGESDLGAALQCGSRIETAREPTTQSLLLSVPVMVPMSCLHFISCSLGGAKD
jgi:hypothetical protein